ICWGAPTPGDLVLGAWHGYIISFDSQFYTQS
ncbi:hypothetical protein VN97_g9877, partial [Penicillium thymicola]